jgi:NADH:ubiquinone oxidoreductase subunit E
VNEAFGWKSEDPRHRRKIHRQNELSKAILTRLTKHRLEGGSLNAEEAFQPIADELGTSRRVVEEVYRKEGQFIKKLPRGNPNDVIHVFPRKTLPVPRRRGRPILRDKD